jgi:WD40 repeat protein
MDDFSLLHTLPSYGCHYGRPVVKMVHQPTANKFATIGADNSWALWSFDGVESSNEDDFNGPIIKERSSIMSVEERLSSLAGSKQDACYTALDVHSGGEYILAGRGDGKMEMWGQNGLSKAWNSSGGAVLDVKFHPFDQTFVTTSISKHVTLFDSNTCSQISQIRSEHEDSVNACCWWNKHMLITASSDKTIRFVDTRVNQVVQIFNGHSCAVESLALNGTTLASCDSSNNIRVWDIRAGVQTSSCIFEKLQPSTQRKQSLFVSPCTWNSSGTTLAVGCRDGVVRLVDFSATEEGKVEIKQTLKDHIGSAVTGVAFTQIKENEEEFISCSTDGTLRLYRKTN